MNQRNTPALVSALRSPPLFGVMTIVMALFMASGALFDLLKTDEVIRLFADLGYPEYFIRFIGTLKLLGVAVILVDRPPRLVQWA